MDRLGEGLIAAARSDDGLVQAFVDTSGGHVVGIQWHPEENAEDRRLFEDLVSQARVFAAGRKEGAR
nr:gamma-glutamyl-gamma-aminobutyrate hydrolase family protein [Microbacterium sp. Se5.02b]